jgi:trimethylamine--corrinoid protein Co-methyltransferase
MNSGCRSEAVPNYRLLTDDQIEVIHLASLEILETIGVQVAHAEGARLLEEAGCRSQGNDIFQIPNWLVEACLCSAPSRITVYDQRGNEAMRLEGRNIYFGLGTDLITTYDVAEGQARESQLQDVRNAATVADTCEDIDFIASFALPYDVPTNAMYLHCVKAMLEHSVKPVFFTAAGREDLELILEMASAVAGGRDALRDKPFLIHYSEPTPPLRHSYGALSKLFLCAEREIPICYPPGAMLGGSAPVTLAGAVAQVNAEAISGIVLHQLKRKGAPIISGYGAVPLDMRTSVFSYGAPGHVLTKSACAELYNHYGIPVWSTVGSDAHALDGQAGIEHGIGTLMAALDGANLIHDAGYLGQGLLGDPRAILMSDEIISYVKHILRGFRVTRDTLAVDAIRDVGPGGDFIAHDHTYHHFREEQWQPRLFNRDEPDTWKRKGSKTYDEVLAEKVREILATHSAEPFPQDVQRQVDEIARRAEEALGDMDFKA